MSMASHSSQPMPLSSLLTHTTAMIPTVVTEVHHLSPHTLLFVCSFIGWCYLKKSKRSGTNKLPPRTISFALRSGPQFTGHQIVLSHLSFHPVQANVSSWNRWQHLHVHVVTNCVHVWHDVGINQALNLNLCLFPLSSSWARHRWVFLGSSRGNMTCFYHCNRWRNLGRRNNRPKPLVLQENGQMGPVEHWATTNSPVLCDTRCGMVESDQRLASCRQVLDFVRLDSH